MATKEGVPVDEEAPVVVKPAKLPDWYWLGPAGADAAQWRLRALSAAERAKRLEAQLHEATARANELLRHNVNANDLLAMAYESKAVAVARVAELEKALAKAEAASSKWSVLFHAADARANVLELNPYTLAEIQGIANGGHVGQVAGVAANSARGKKAPKARKV